VKDITTESKWQLKAGFVIQRELYEKKARKLTSDEKPIGDNTSSRNRRKRKRSEAMTEQQPETKESHELSTQPAAANIGDGGHPMPPNESGTQREAEREPTTTRLGRKAKAAPRLIEAMTSEIARATADDVEGEIYCYATMFPDDNAFIYIKFLFYVLQLYSHFYGSSYPHGPPLAWRDQQETKFEKCKDALTNC
jgi:hypothetical protein